MDFAVWSAEDQKEGLKPHPPEVELEGRVGLEGSLMGVPEVDRVCSRDLREVVGAGRMEPMVAELGVEGRGMGPLVLALVGVWTREMGRF